MDSTPPQEPDPKTARVPIVPLEQMVTQELAIKRAKLAVGKAEPASPAQRWLLLVLVLLILLGGTILIFKRSRDKIQTLNDHTRAATSPTPASRR